MGVTSLNSAPCTTRPCYAIETDPEKADYVVEHGASRNFQALKLAEEAAAKEARELEEEEKNNPMKRLENRTKASKQEMESMDTLEEQIDLNQRRAKVDLNQMLEQKQEQLMNERKKQDEEDEAEIRAIYGKTADGQTIKRLVDDGYDDEVLSVRKTVKPEVTPAWKKPKFSNTCIGNLSKKNPLASLVRIKRKDT